jgi:hypothetical protein
LSFISRDLNTSSISIARGSISRNFIRAHLEEDAYAP